MKALKICALVVGGVLLLAVLAVGAALTPAVQTWAARRILAGRPNLSVTIGRVAAGLSAVELRDLRLDQNGLVVTAPEISARYSIWDFWRRRQVNVGAVTVRGLVIDARRMAPTAAPAAAPVTAGGPSPALAIFDLAAPLPVDVRVGQLDLGGRALLPGGREVDFRVQGGGIALGQSGRLDWRLDYADATVGVPVKAAHLAGSLGIHLAADRRVDVVDFNATASAEGARLPADQVRLAVKAEQPTAQANETVNGQLALVHEGVATPLCHAQVEVRRATRELTGTWDLALKDEQIAPFCADLSLPELAADGNGRFSYQAASGAGAAEGVIEGRLTDLGRVDPQLGAVGALRVHAAFDGAGGGGVARLTRLELAVATPDGRNLVRVTAEQPVSYHTADGRFELARPDAELANVSIGSLPLAWVQPFVKPVAIAGGLVSGTFAVEVAADGRQARLRATQPFTATGVTVRDQGRALVEDLTLSLSPTIEYTAARITAEIPDLKLAQPAGDSVDGNIAVTVAPVSKAAVITFRAALRERLAGVLRPFLPAGVGALRVESEAEGAVAGQDLRLDRFTGAVRTDAGALVAAVETLQPVAVNFATERIAASRPDAAAARLRLGEIPLGVADAWVPRAQFAGALTGGAVEVGLPGKDQLTLQTTAPLTVRGLGVTLGGQPQVHDLDVAADFSASRRGRAVAGEIRRVELRQGTATLVTLAGTGEATLGGALAASGKGRLEADLAALGRQPALASLAVLSRGRLAADYDVGTGASVQARATLALQDLTSRATNQPLGDFHASIEATVKPDASAGTVKIPLTLKVGDRQSDLAVDGSFSRTAALLTLNGRIASHEIHVDDFKVLGGLVPSAPAGGAPAPATPPGPAEANPAPSAPPAVSAAPAPDTRPFWAGFGGTVGVDLKRIDYGANYVISGVGGALEVSPTRLAVENLAGSLQQKPFHVVGAITFTAGKPQPYGLDATVNLSGVDLGAILRAADPGEPPAMESVLSATAKVTGRGATLPDLAQNTYGDVDLTGSKGVLRALSKRGQGELAGAASTLLGLFGAMRGSDTTVAVGELAGMLREMPFDQFKLHLVRGADLNLKLTSLEFISPTTRLTGTGGIQYQQEVPIVDQPLNVQLQLAGKAEMATVLNRLRLLNGQRDDKKYYLMSSPFVVRGTLAKPDSKQLWTIVAEAAAGALLR